MNRLLRALLVLFVVACGSHAQPNDQPRDAAPSDASKLRYGGPISPQGGTLTAVTTLTNSGLQGGCTSGACSISLLRTCSGGQGLVWNAGTSSWGCGAGGITNSAGANVIMMSDGTNAVASHLTDSGGVISSTESFSTTGLLTSNGGLHLDSSTSDAIGPELDWIGHNGNWVIGIDVANLTASRDFVIAGRRGTYSFEDGVCNGTTTLTSAAQGGFSTSQVGRAIAGSNIVGGTTITAVASANSVTLSNTCTTGTSLRFTVTDSSTYDILYMKHRGSLAPTLGLGVTPPDGSYRLQLAASDSENAMGTLSVRVGPSQTGPALAVRDSTPNVQWMIDSDFMMAAPFGSHVSVKGTDSNNNPLDLFNTAKSNALGFWIGSNYVHNFTSWVMGNAFTAAYNLEGDSSGNLYALHSFTADGSVVLNNTSGNTTINGTATIQTTSFTNGGGIQMAAQLGGGSSVATSGDGVALRFVQDSGLNYFSRIAAVNTASSPSFLNPKLIFQVETNNTSGLGNLVTKFEVTNTGPVSDDALDMTTHQIHNVVDPTSAQDAATKHYVDNLSSGGSPSVSLTNGSPPSTVNATTEGTIDWIIFGGNFGNSGTWLTSPASVHSKRDGGWLYKTFQGFNGTGTVPSSTASSVAGTTISSTASDDQVGAAASTTTYWVLFGGSSLNFGFGTRPPARTSQQVLRIYATVFGCTVTTTATLTVSGTSNTNTFTIGATQTNQIVTITFTGGKPNDELTVRMLCTTNGGSGSLSVLGATLSTI